jgi:hypothetical protein
MMFMLMLLLVFWPTTLADLQYTFDEGFSQEDRMAEAETNERV